MRLQHLKLLRLRLLLLFIVAFYNGFEASRTETPLSLASEVTESLADWSSIPKYVVLLGSSHAAPLRTGSQRTVTMTTYKGRKFICTLPSRDDSVAADANEDLEHPATQQEQLRPANSYRTEPDDSQDSSVSSPSSTTSDSEAQLLSEENIISVFRKQTEGSCISRNEGFWSFEICLFDSAVQYHPSSAGRQLKFSLGRFVGDRWDRAESRYVQVYEGGTDNRKAEAWFECPPKPQNGKVSFVRALEPDTFSYRLTLYADMVCEAQDPIKDASSTSASDSASNEDNRASVLLKPLQNVCMNLNTGWWSYEFCYGRSLRQLHVEKNGADERTTSEFSLGKWPDSKIDSALIDARTSLVKGHTPASSYFRQEYGDGALCDLTNLPRQTEVRFLCDKFSSSHQLASVKELATCSYLVKIATPLVCSHPDFMVEKQDVKQIVCRPQPRETTSAKEAPSTSSGNEAKISKDHFKTDAPKSKTNGDDSTPNHDEL